MAHLLRRLEQLPRVGAIDEGWGRRWPGRT